MPKALKNFRISKPRYLQILLRKNYVHCCPVDFKLAQFFEVGRCQCEDVYCIPFDEKVRVIILSQLHSEIDAFEVCQVYRERSWQDPPRVKHVSNSFLEGVSLMIHIRVKHVSNLSFEGVGVMIHVSFESDRYPKRGPSAL